MVEDAAGGFSDLVTEEEYQYIIENNIELQSFGIMTSEEPGPSVLDPLIMNAIGADESTLTMDDFKYMTPYLNFPPSEPHEVCNTDYSGPLNFEVFVDPNGLKNPWEYSTDLNKIYIDIKHKFPINFSAKFVDENLFVRAMPIFEEDRYFQELVHRCICHEQPKDPSNIGVPAHVVQHIIRCDNNKTRYFGDKKEGKRLNIVIPLSAPQAGTDSVKEFFQFVCKNSCPGGMNRKPIQVIFTLENEFGEVLGRRVLCVRVCSCPKRDREKEEKKKEKEKEKTAKKRKLEKTEKSSTDSSDSEDNKLFPFSINIVGTHNFQMLCKYSRCLMADEILQKQEKNESDTVFRNCLKEINALEKKYT